MVTELKIPDIGSDSLVDVIEVMVSPGDTINLNDSLVTLESDKASMEVPAESAGKIIKVHVKVGDKVKQGDPLLSIEAVGAKEAPAVNGAPKKTEPSAPASVPAQASTPAPVATSTETKDHDGLYAGPGVRRIARELGLDLAQISGNGHKGRITKADVTTFVKQRLSGASTGLGIAPAPEIDFSQFGSVETKPLNKIKKLTGQFTHRSWITIPHVTQFDEADITILEAFRKEQQASAQSAGVKLTPLIFIMKAVVKALQTYPQFNSSLSANGQDLIFKHYFHIGVAVDTPNGLVVPVIRDVDQKGLLQLARELGEISTKAREKGLSPKEMSGNCFTISSLGGIGGTGFTPIVNGSDVAILGVSKAKMQPVYQEGTFVPRLIMPFSLSYDHRVIDGAEAARFTQFLAQALSDIRTLLL